MSNSAKGRMLLSHNFDVSPDVAPALSREEFAEVFRLGLGDRRSCQTRLINHPHWTVEILFELNQFSPKQIGEFCAQALADQRISQGIDRKSLPEILVLGGVKNTPPSSDSPDALQTGDWGVDVIEPLVGANFLQGISWDVTISSKPVDEIFKVELKDFNS
ncbi:hypothetical protein APA_3887 [Pseudanabaena sp. lw0831]|uniref:DUF2656 domain-containing protein n=1 Tax=Pseudanabaena sp. lw0831 TaxID=1357935 RepID=UPI001A20F98E|nr:DUF2656 domain-containing protein [Pseudanabaena sp. lw0831]GBO55737.1 hypothetical protein APA_3887 [Pseudanabaena sp. lw0831]